MATRVLSSDFSLYLRACMGGLAVPGSERGLPRCTERAGATPRLKRWLGNPHLASTNGGTLDPLDARPVEYRLRRRHSDSPRSQGSDERPRSTRHPRKYSVAAATSPVRPRRDPSPPAIAALTSHSRIRKSTFSQSVSRTPRVRKDALLIWTGSSQPVSRPSETIIGNDPNEQHRRQDDCHAVPLRPCPEGFGLSTLPPTHERLVPEQRR